VKNVNKETRNVLILMEMEIGDFFDQDDDDDDDDDRDNVVVVFGTETLLENVASESGVNVISKVRTGMRWCMCVCVCVCVCMCVFEKI